MRGAPCINAARAQARAMSTNTRITTIAVAALWVDYDSHHKHGRPAPAGLARYVYCV